MTPEEAIRKLCVYSSTNGSGQCTSAEHLEAKKIALKAIERQMPKKAEHEDGVWSICPNCGGSVCNDTEHAVNKEVSYCEHCGQAIDWSDNSEIG